MSSIVFISRKSTANTIYRAWKEGRIEMKRGTANRLYAYADNNWEGTLDTTHQGLLKAEADKAAKALFSSCDAEAQEHIDAFARYAEARTYEELRKVKPAPQSPGTEAARKEAMASLAYWTAR